jgi:hypothetical protein
MVLFGGQPQGIPDGNVAQDYWNRKNCFAMNCQVQESGNLYSLSVRILFGLAASSSKCKDTVFYRYKSGSQA